MALAAIASRRGALADMDKAAIDIAKATSHVLPDPRGRDSDVLLRLSRPAAGSKSISTPEWLDIETNLLREAGEGDTRNFGLPEAA